LNATKLIKLALNNVTEIPPNLKLGIEREIKSKDFKQAMTENGGVKNPTEAMNAILN
jgi:hypothetical protein